MGQCRPQLLQCNSGRGTNSNLQLAFLPKSERGAILVLFAVIVPVLIILIAYGLNIYFVYTAKGEQEKEAFKVATAALDGDVKTDVTGLSQGDAAIARLNGALQRAERYLYSMDQTTLKESYSENSGRALDLGQPFGDGRDGKLEPGIWYYENDGQVCAATNPDVGNNCPCGGSGTGKYWVGPCFRSLTETELRGGENPNAFKVTLYDHGLRSLLSVFPGSPTVDLTSTATAAFSPRKTVVLLDLSRSSHQTTHQPVEQSSSSTNPNKNGIESALKLRAELTCNSTCATSNSAGGCRYEGGRIAGLYDELFRVEYVGVPAKKTRPAGAPVSTKHYASDFSCFQVCYDRTDPSCVPDQYLIDTYQDPPNGYYGPEPLTTFIYGANRVLTEFSNLSVPGDMFGFVGFDQTVTLKNRIQELVPVSSDEAQQFLTATDTDSSGAAAALSTRINNYNLFPRTDAMNYLPGAFDRALKLFTDSPDKGENTDNMIILFSDGVSNCTQTSCDPSEATYNNSILELRQFVDSYIVPNNITVHIVLAGNMVQPHTLLKAQGGKCVTDDQFRDTSSQSDLFTQPQMVGTGSDTLENASAKPNLFFHRPNELYNIARETKGIWAPLRPPCQAGVDHTADLGAACAAAGSGVVTNVTIAGQSAVDSQGRLVCEPTGISVRDQVKAYIKEMMSRQVDVQVQ